MIRVALTVEQVVDQTHLDHIIDLVNDHAYVAGVEVLPSR